MLQKTRTKRFEQMLGRRELLRLWGGGLALMLGSKVARALPQAIPANQDRYHHVIFQNDVVRLMRVLIPPGESTGWYGHAHDYVVTVLRGGKTQIETEGVAGAIEADMLTDSVDYGAYQEKPTVQRITNAGASLNDQVAFEILRQAPGNFGKADRSAAKDFAMVLDNERVRAWRLKLDPGLSTPVFTQNGPGLRVVLAGDRLIETKPGEIGREMELRAGDANFTLPATQTLTNAGDVPLDLIDFELR